MTPKPGNARDSLPASQLDKRLFRASKKYGMVPTQLFFVLPETLLRILHDSELALHQLDPALYQLETEIKDTVSAIAGAVGVWNGQPIIYRFLAPPPPVSTLKDQVLYNFAKCADWKPVMPNIDANLQAVDAAIDDSYKSALGYCGWLLINPQFIDEHERFFIKWRAMVLQHGLPIRGAAPEGIEKWFTDQGKLSTLDHDAERYAREFGELLNRWNLYALCAPYLPEPMQIQHPVLLAHQAPHLTRAGGKLIYIPDNVPVPDRDTAREMLSNSNATDSSQHLKEWHAIVNAKNKGKNAVSHFSRLFRLQHYWRVLHNRWGKHLHGRIQSAQRAFSEWLEPSDSNPEQSFETIRSDLRAIARRRGDPDWYRKTPSSDQF
jgi:hypothetical protein